MTLNSVPSESDFDVGIVGGGPMGVAAAIGISSEGPSVVVLDQRSLGGQIASSSKSKMFLASGSME